ncbi:Farnesoate epoxidase, partial [Orchesella cincta]
CLLTEAVILEIFRITSIGPFGVVHTALTDIHLGSNYTISKGTLLIPNIYYIHHNKDVWGDPEIFRPERFLNSEGRLDSKRRIRHSHFRQCLGESLAKDVTFLYIAKLLQAFDILPDPSGVKPDFYTDIGFGQFPKAFNVVIKLEHNQYIFKVPQLE